MTVDEKAAAENASEMRFLEWNHSEIKDAECMYRQAAWEALKKSFAALADNVSYLLTLMPVCG